MKILIVESSPHFRRGLKETLAEYYDVLCLPDGTQALAILEDNQDFDIILLDGSLQEPTALEVYWAIQEFYPHLGDQVLFMSNNHQELRDISNLVITRPVDPGQLASVLPVLFESVVYEEML